MTIADKYVWATWSTALLVPWVGLFVGVAPLRRVMALSSVFTMPLGLTEPIFVPRYWNPPSLFDLAQRTGFDIESLIFCFAIGGVGAVLYNVMTRHALRTIVVHERHAPHHRHHRAALLSPLVAFGGLYFLPWNPIYPAIVAMMLGGAATVACRPDLKWHTVVGGTLFALYYAVFTLMLEWSAPGYIARVWNLAELSGIRIVGIPLEELLFGFAFGLYWSGIYEHITWNGDALHSPFEEQHSSRP
ncbi:hypothetical protein KEX41_28695 (plasmid) [Burkholderia thailandensis]|uniref:lycopene cyclase domain-containing protein n=1 Tax=Burkholderia thailandensis TaxID=57975 RepID=UPI00192E2479|nr:lycopene cyclase domain-containing protein [Burkholderia thailandensis]MBS2132166.1 hypothetical protein [Burkholderia thailandensis]QRA15269.1 hypothetical protein JMY07_29120 [Burkholderia thailandensis]